VVYEKNGGFAYSKLLHIFATLNDCVIVSISCPMCGKRWLLPNPFHLFIKGQQCTRCLVSSSRGTPASLVAERNIRGATASSSIAMAAYSD